MGCMRVWFGDKECGEKGNDFAERLVSHRVNGLPGRFSRQEDEVKPESQVQLNKVEEIIRWRLPIPTRPTKKGIVLTSTLSHVLKAYFAFYSSQKVQDSIIQLPLLA